MKEEKNKRRYVLLFGIVIVVLLLIIVILTIKPLNETKSFEQQKQDMYKNSKKLLEDKNFNDDKVEKALNINIYENEKSGYNSNSQEETGGNINDTDISAVSKRKSFFNGYKRVNRNELPSFEHIEDLIQYGNNNIDYVQDFTYDVLAQEDYKMLRITFYWMDTSVELYDYHLYSKDLALEYEPVEVNPGSLVFKIPNVAQDEKFYLNIRATFLHGTSIVLQEQEDIDFDYEAEGYADDMEDFYIIEEEYQ